MFWFRIFLTLSNQFIKPIENLMNDSENKLNLISISIKKVWKFPLKLRTTNLFANYQYQNSVGWGKANLGKKTK